MNLVFPQVLAEIVVLGAVSGCMANDSSRALDYDAGTVSYYISDLGDDANDGSSPLTPLKTISKLNTLQFKGGDRILFRRGGVWGDETLHLTRADSESEKSVTIQAYGVGEKPKLRPGYGVPMAIQIGDPLRDAQGGWTIRDLDIATVQAGVVLYNRHATPDGLLIEDCDFHDIHGAGMFQYDYMYHSTAIVVSNAMYDDAHRTSHVHINRVNVDHADDAIELTGINDLILENITTSYTGRAAVSLMEVSRGELSHLSIKYAGIDGMIWGTAGLQVSQSQHILMRDSEIAYTQKPGTTTDGVGVDIEGSDVEVTALRLNIHDNQGSAFLIFRNPEWGVDNLQTNIIDCETAMNGLSDPSAVPAFLRHYYNANSGGEIRGNRIHRAAPDQALNLIDENLTTSWPNSYSIRDNEFR